MKDFYVEKKARGNYYRLGVKIGGGTQKINIGYVSKKELYRLRRLINKLVEARRQDVPLAEEVTAMINSPLHQNIAEQLLKLKLVERTAEVKIPTLRDAVNLCVKDRHNSNLFNAETAEAYTASVSKKPRKLSLIQCVGDDRRIDDITPSDIAGWITKTKLSEGSIGKYLEAYRASVKHFLKHHPETQFPNVFAEHLEDNSYQSTMSDADKLKQDKFLTNTNFVEDLMSGQMYQNSEKRNAEYKLLLELERWLGMRAAEIRILRWRDIEDGVVTIRGKREGKKGSHVDRTEMRMRQSPMWPEAIEALSFFREHYANEDDVYVINEICDLRKKPEFQKYVGLKKVAMRGRWESDLSKPIQTIYEKNGYPDVIQPNHIWKKNRVTELKNEVDDNGSPKHLESNIAYWVGDTEEMATQVYQGYTRATQEAARRTVEQEAARRIVEQEAARCSVEAEWQSNAIKTVHTESLLHY